MLRPTLFAQRKLCVSPNALRSTEIVCLAQRKLCVSQNALRSTQILCFAQRKLCASPNASPNATFNAITFSSYSYKRISLFTITIVWTVLHVCHCCHYMSLLGTAHAISRESVDSIRWDATRPFSNIEGLRTPKRGSYKNL